MTAPIPPSGEQVELVLADQRAVVVEVGGGLRAYSTNGRDLLDGYGVDEMCPSGRGQVLIPWPNRLEDGSYEFDGHSHELPITELDTHTAIHGLVRWAAWKVAEREPSRVVMEHVLHPQPGYPFSLALSIDYRLSGDGLSARTTATNLGTTTCPYGAGAHPYVSVGTPIVDPATLRVRARTVMHSNARAIPIGSERVDGTEYDFRRPRAIGATRLDHAFTDLERDEHGLASVQLIHPDGEPAVTVWLDETYPYVMLFTGDPLPDVDRRSLAVEPMTCPPNAFRSAEAVISLAPGGSFTSVWGIAPS